MSQLPLTMTPAPGTGMVRFAGDVIRFQLHFRNASTKPSQWSARLRTTIGQGRQLRAEICGAHYRQLSGAGLAWRDLEMQWDGKGWSIELPLAEVGYFKAKAYALDERGWQHWPDGADFGVNVQPDWCRTANIIYCAFPRMFGPGKERSVTIDASEEKEFQQLENNGFTVIPPSGRLRDLIKDLPHIFESLGCRILHLLPVGPTPTTLAKFGRFGSPYAIQDLTAIDPALVEFDRKTTGVQQFCELTDAAHCLGGRVFLDLVINHTGWGSDLFEDHPEWFLKDEDGTFVSPGAWGTIWEDLVELNPHSTELWDCLAEIFLTWCRRGVDGFRCDAGYKVPVLVWQYITARVHREFPETVFLLEGLGGAWEDTAIRLTEGGMQWAYSELFQNYSPEQVCGYLGHAWKQNDSAGLLVNYSETHDNERLAAKGRDWSLLRNRLCALASQSGGFGFTNGVEWLAPEKVNVHSRRGLAWGSRDNIVAELLQLNRLLSEHPCFFDGAELTQISTAKDEVFAFIRVSSEHKDLLLILVNLDVDQAHDFVWQPDSLFKDRKSSRMLLENLAETLRKGTAFNLAGTQSKATCSIAEDGGFQFSLNAGEAACFSATKEPQGLSGNAYRHARARSALAIQSAHDVGVEYSVIRKNWRELSDRINEDARSFLTHLLVVSDVKADPDRYQPVATWSLPDRRRVVPVPPGHWLIIEIPMPFRVTLRHETEERTIHLNSVPTRTGWLAVVPPGQPAGDSVIEVEAFDGQVERHRGAVRFLKEQPEWTGVLNDPVRLNHLAAERTILLTNGRGGMARINLDLGRVRSKYDCLLGANLHPDLPVDRHVMIKRLRLWANADGFITQLSADNLVHFESGPPALWRFQIPSGGGRSVLLELSIEMPRDENTIVVNLVREQSQDAPEESLLKNRQPPCAAISVRVVTRFDLEDRNFHWETHRNDSADHHFNDHTLPLGDSIGFLFQPADDRFVKVTANAGEYHPEPEWSENLAHPVEVSRGQTGQGDGWSPGWFEVPLDKDGESALFIATAEKESNVSFAASADPAGRTATTEDPSVAGETVFLSQLHLAAEQFIVRRESFKSVIAGYPWFLDWGRDTLICARGLIAGGWTEEVRQLLIAFGRFEEKGTLPNTIHGADASNRDTSDAPLWYGIVAEELAAVTGPDAFSLKVDDKRSVADVLAGIADGYLRGTPNGIRVDRETGLVWSPSHFTWMDTNYPAGTPREGYPIEIQALWIRLLQLLERLGVPCRDKSWSVWADLALASLNNMFWVEAHGWFSDVLLAGPGIPAKQAQQDTLLRSNCLIPISLGLLTGERARLCLRAAAKYLVIPGALRSLAPLPAEPPLTIIGNDGQVLNDPANPYQGRYEGDEDTRRKPAYHNGTAWTWTFPIFCEGLVRAYPEDDHAQAAARAYLGSMDRLMFDGCFGQIPEVLDGDAPHEQRGCDAQAWGVTEALRVLKLLSQ